MVARKWCFVPGCGNTTLRTPTKIFVSVPKHIMKRKKWFAAVGRDVKEVSSSTTLYCCEDHFNLEQDMENYLEYKLSKVKARLKVDVVPHILRNKTGHEANRFTLGRKRKMEELLRKSTECLDHMPKPSTSCNAEEIEPHNSRAGLKFRCDRATQTRILTHYRNKSSRVSFSATRKYIATSPVTSEIFLQKSFKKPKIQNLFQSYRDDSNTDTTLETSDTEWQPNDDSSKSNITPEDQKIEEAKFRSIFVRKIEKRLQMYTGIPKEYCNFISILEAKSSLKKYVMYLTFYKIKTNNPFQQIADLFGISKAYASALFTRSTLVLAEYMKQLIHWPSSASIKRNLPIQFRMSFCNVQSIIDCLEIEIQKPSAAVQQSLTWSEHKKCNTMKYLISCTPDGLVNFVSSGYGGRASDAAIFEDCGYLEVLPENSVVMADRGFKQIETSLGRKKCTLVRSSSVASNVKMTENDVLLAKRIASVRIHVERAVNRIRDFNMFGPRTIIPAAMVQMLDNVVVISCAIINLQKPIIKQ